MKLVGAKARAIEAKLKTLTGFHPSQMIVSCDGLSGLAIDEPNAKICIASNNCNRIVHRIFDFSDVYSAEIVEDGTSITKTDRASQVGGAVVGGLLFGGVGAVVGGLSGKKETLRKIKKINLRITLNDISSPIHDVVFLNTEVKGDSFLYKSASDRARSWLGIMDVVIKRSGV